MPVSRGDVVLAFVENLGAPGGKLRLALVVQSDRNNTRLNETIIAAITSNTSRQFRATLRDLEGRGPARVALLGTAPTHHAQ